MDKIGNQIKRGVNSLTYVNPVTWGVIPGLVIGIIVLLF